jgi:hypothetical protein
MYLSHPVSLETVQIKWSSIIATLQTLEAEALNRRDISLPTLNLLDPAGSIQSIKDFFASLFGALVQAGQNAVTLVEDSKKGLESLATSVEESVKTDIKEAVNSTITKIKKAVSDSPIGTALRVAKCGEDGVGAAVSAGVKTGNCISRIFQTADRTIPLFLWLLELHY